MTKQEYQETHNPILKDLYKKIFIGLLDFAPNSPLFVGEKFIEIVKTLQSNSNSSA